MDVLLVCYLSSLKSFLSTSRALCRKFWMVLPFFIYTHTHNTHRQRHIRGEVQCVDLIKKAA